jgi:hypothetical protein
LALNVIQVSAVVLTVVIGWPVDAAQDYQIRLQQPGKVGSKYRLSGIGSQTDRATITSGGKMIQSTENAFTVELTADVTELETEAKGHVTRKSLTVISSKITKEGASKPLLPQGTVVLATVEGDRTVFKVDGELVADDVAKGLSSLISVYTGGPDDDEVFGTKTRRRVGESWSLDADAVTAFLKEIGAQAPKEGISGSTTLQKVEDNHLFISASMIVKQLVMPLPSGFKCDAGEFRAEFSGRFPVGRSNSGLDGTQSLLISMTGKRPQTDTQAEITMKIHSEASSRYSISGVK